MDVVDAPVGGVRFNPFLEDNLERQRRLARAYQEGGQEGLRRELEKIQAENAERLRSASSMPSDSTNSPPKT
jgi:hypothetical protein